MASRIYTSYGPKLFPKETTRYFDIKEVEPSSPDKKPSKIALVTVIIFIIIVIIIVISVGAFLIWYLLIKKQSVKEGSRMLNEKCTITRDCNGSLICNGGVCKQSFRGPCTSNSDCSSGLICSDNSCRRIGGGMCNVDDDCAADYYCFDGICKGGPDTNCISDTGCYDPFVCQEYKCTKKTCTTDSDCGVNEICFSNSYCILSEGADCRFDNQCNGDSPEISPALCTANVCT